MVTILFSCGTLSFRTARLILPLLVVFSSFLVTTADPAHRTRGFRQPLHPLFQPTTLSSHTPLPPSSPAMPKPSPYYRKKTSSHSKPPKRKNRTYAQNDYASQWYANTNWRSRTNISGYDAFSEDTIRRQLCDLVIEPDSYTRYPARCQSQEYANLGYEAREIQWRDEGGDARGRGAELAPSIVGDAMRYQWALHEGSTEYERVYERVEEVVEGIERGGDGKGEVCCWHHEPYMGWVWCCGLTCWMMHPSPSLSPGLVEGYRGCDAASVDEVSGLTREYNGYCVGDAEVGRVEGEVKSGKISAAVVMETEGWDCDGEDGAVEWESAGSTPELELSLSGKDGAGSDMDMNAVNDECGSETPTQSFEVLEIEHRTEETEGSKCEPRGRDDWPCDFCGTECFC